MGILTFAFLTFYTQDLRSSLVEPLYETLPDTLNNIDTRTQNMFSFGVIPFFDIIRAWNLNILKSYTINWNSDSGTSLGVMSMRKIAQSPNAFAILERETYYQEILRLQSIIKNISSLKLSDGNLAWQWRLSQQDSGCNIKTIVYHKYQEWQESLNMFMLKLNVGKLLAKLKLDLKSSYLQDGDILYPSKQVIVKYEYEKNPHRLDDITLGKQKITTSGDFTILFISMAALLLFYGARIITKFLRFEF